MKRTTAPNSVAGKHVDKNAGTGTPGTKAIAEDKNLIQEELCHAIEHLGLALDGADEYQLAKTIVGLSHVVGELVMLETEETPGDYFPAIPRNVDNDVDSSVYPLLVTKLRAVKAKVGTTTDHSVTVAGSVITFVNTTPANQLLNLLQADAVVAGWHNGGEIANFLGGADYTTAATRRCVNVAGTDYAITAIDLVNRTVTVSGTPASGSQTASVYTYRVAGSSTTVRLHKIAGFAPIAAGDAVIEVVGGFRRMDRGQGRRYGSSSAWGGFSNGNPGTGATEMVVTSGALAQIPLTDGTNGTPRVGKTTDPRTAGLYFYTWAGIKV